MMATNIADLRVKGEPLTALAPFFAADSTIASLVVADFGSDCVTYKVYPTGYVTLVCDDGTRVEYEAKVGRWEVVA
jgi:hypothetical protein